MVDQSKFGNEQMFSFAALDEIDVLVTDNRADDEAVAAIEGARHRGPPCLTELPPARQPARRSPSAVAREAADLVRLAVPVTGRSRRRSRRRRTSSRRPTSRARS